MKKTISRNKNIAYIFAVAIAIFLASLLFVRALQSYALYSGSNTTMSRGGLQRGNLATSVSFADSEITILTHGLGGGPKDWSKGF